MIRFAVLVLAVLLPLGSVAAAPPSRVVSLGGDLTEIVYAVGRGECLVAADITSTFPEAANRLPRVGYVRALSAEGILALRPDIVLVSGQAGPPETLDRLRAVGVRLVNVPAEPTLDGVTDKIHAVAAALGAVEEGNRLAAAFAEERRALATRVVGTEPLPAVYLMARGDGVLIGAGRGTAADAALTAAGLRNVLADLPGYKPVSPEVLMARAPQVVVTGARTVATCGGEEAFRAQPAVAGLPAAREGRVLVFDDMYLLGMGPRSARAAGELAQAARR